MNTKDKLLKAFDEFRPHINGHKTAMDLFFEAIEEVDSMQSEIDKLRQTCECKNIEYCHGTYKICRDCGKTHRF